MATKATSYAVYISSDKNYRYSVATIQPYKGNREKLSKPHWYNALKEYLLESCNAVVVDGIEADDAMGIEQWTSSDGSTVICTIDKDLDMIPGLHYNWVKESLYHVAPTQAAHWFYTQLLMGDRTDNIKGVPGIGKAIAQKILKDCLTPQDYLCVIGMQYAIAYDDPEAAMLENARLLWIQRKPNQQWDFNTCTF